MGSNWYVIGEFPSNCMWNSLGAHLKSESQRWHYTPEKLNWQNSLVGCFVLMNFSVVEVFAKSFMGISLCKMVMETSQRVWTHNYLGQDTCGKNNKNNLGQDGKHLNESFRMIIHSFLLMWNGDLQLCMGNFVSSWNSGNSWLLLPPVKFCFLS